MFTNYRKCESNSEDRIRFNNLWSLLWKGISSRNKYKFLQNKLVCINPKSEKVCLFWFSVQNVLRKKIINLSDKILEPNSDHCNHLLFYTFSNYFSRFLYLLFTLTYHTNFVAHLLKEGGVWQFIVANLFSKENIT